MSQCSESPSAAVSGGGSSSVGGGAEIMLFGVRVKVVDPMRKSLSLNNLSEYEPLNKTINLNNNDLLMEAAENGGSAAGYASADDAVPLPSNGSRERKRGVPWTEEEHKLFLIGLQKVGKGDWRGISRNYVKTRTPTQVASHAQKYFLRRTNLNRRRRRSSLFDITTDSVTAMPIEEGRNIHKKSSVKPVTPPPTLPPPVTSNINGFSVVPFHVNVAPVLISGYSTENSVLGQSDLMNNSPALLVHPVHIPVLPIPTSSQMVMDLNSYQDVPNEPSSLSLRLSLSSGHDHSPSRDSAFHGKQSFKNGDSIISVA
ncbi:hypothetical protein ACJIZ3_005238 [Penstemon smallii]|uniref:Uncharacterized protein n=1 Tax=Penstemon smallii TaxID=265156 RepID=A0ABD3S4A8_9LAMI